ncbi:MAG: EF-hand domain-containing protein [Vulcanimicrobiota bacterium]
MAIGISNNYSMGGTPSYCCPPWPRPWPQPEPQPWPQPWPGPWGWNENRGNLENATVGRHGFLGLERTRGYAVDLNGDGRYTPGRDAVLAMDLNRDGRVTPDEIEKSREMLQAMGGNFDFNHDGQVTICERLKGEAYQRQMRQYDSNGDGRLDAGEFARAGGRVLVDSNRDGRFQDWEQHSPFNFPTGGFGRGSLNYIDPFFGRTSFNERSPWCGSPWGPWGQNPLRSPHYC